MQRELGALARAAGENPQAGQGQQPEGNLSGLAGHLVGHDLVSRRIGELHDVFAARQIDAIEAAVVIAKALVDFLKAECAEARPEQAQTRRACPRRPRG